MSRMKDRSSLELKEQNRATHGKAAHGRASVRSTVIAFVVLGITVLSLGFWVAGLDRTSDPFSLQAAPPVTIIEPADGDAVGSSITLVFETPARLQLYPSGWAAGRLHLHAIVDGIEIMPAAVDIEAVGRNRFTWKLPAQRPGPRTIRLEWATPDHQPVEAGGSSEIQVYVQEPASAAP